MTSPRVAARVADSRRRILEAARVVVAEQGYAAAQVAVVASVADVATGSVYRHFPSKASLFAEMLRAVCDRELAVVRAIADERDRPALERIGDAVATFADRALRGEGLAYAVIVEPMDPGVDQVRLAARARLAEVFGGLIEEGMAAGQLAAQDAGLRGAAVVGAMLEALVAPLSRRAAATATGGGAGYPGGRRPGTTTATPMDSDAGTPGGRRTGAAAPDREAITEEIAAFCRAAVGGFPAQKEDRK
ncbi:MAG: TetR/AcrR family transcriptional regulator [Actinobacteria bacterium]|nr:TetR/AcrR family transcriptional regulator [Actinomycetota bacterium]